ncbi:MULTISPECIES: 3-hydroxyacyl-ACP dehydratase FabZ [Idiomarina]|jgi:3-hydroxyacyl-[acyl-carrier-protein] dehydratase|uniref:3-hydroxyacyl-[acyl-carrier-protein] dehydratase FabZ n=2 Tax=Idiomarina baltica TaxID=190892 RepID=A0A348WN66_9GAMM|nr:MULTISPECIES: 3-hydroxyacyl-ACP dehydratase FabZ [Idiomarina]MAF74552.1 3-hydroxyacyl-[acyl-carrier-protein] dehydratase FabZ [Idiomarinaceae bacterium]MEC8925177.1 3-hydroxyacyl-ACP dehydratase FabZ [Pseudomonadota bacterium]EAQ31181.1 3-hydroxymyristoyl/3-hydroxydecanoyl-(acyl carrier protein)dehydratase [Idiomarina baltica OS145]KXS35682.1 MAG: 3-hydroxyacyl-[acyl-carrier-protein] dehydratase FabZ [Idiomarina sp. T82-3]MBL73591.1 3-hydroxyacyl-[acyl-carrier-protein] dehydratase FabZ [Idi|tara:strand:- start:1846 stop:2304 length:459 start_codon:yes stop_codon:yes gene_type:complete
MLKATDSGFDIQGVLDLLPHRYPFLLIDRVISCDCEKEIHAIKNVSFNEPMFNGHFPGNPIFPGVLLLEGLAQAAGLLGFRITEQKSTANDLYLFAGIDNARFKRQVIPGDTIHFHVTFEKERRGIWKFSGRAEVEGELAACADIICARREV